MERLRSQLKAQPRDETFANPTEELARRSVEIRFESATVKESRCGTSFCLFEVRFSDPGEMSEWLETMVFDDPFNSSGVILEGEDGAVTVFYARKGRDLPTLQTKQAAGD